MAQMSETMNDEIEWEQIADAVSVEGPNERVTREDILEVFQYMKIRKEPGGTEAYAEMILASGDAGIREMIELYHRVLWMEKECLKAGIPVMLFLFLEEKKIS